MFFLTVLAVHLVCVVLLLLAPVVPWVVVLAVLGVGLSMFWQWRRLQTLRAIEHISWSHGQGLWFVSLRGNSLRARSFRAPVLLHWLVCLYLEAGDKRYAIPVFADCTDAHSFRLLRIELNFNKKV